VNITQDIRFPRCWYWQFF